MKYCIVSPILWHATYAEYHFSLGMLGYGVAYTHLVDKGLSVENDVEFLL